MKRVGVDVGGTFTDPTDVDDDAGMIRVHKLPTTPGDPSQGTVQGIEDVTRQAGESLSVLDSVFHGTTIATTRDRAQWCDGRNDHERGLPRHPPHRAGTRSRSISQLPRNCGAALPGRAAPLPADRCPSG